MLTPEQIQTIKDQLLSQLDHFPEEQREAIKNKILSMSNEEVERFVEENELAHMDGEKKQECIFCSIIENKIPSYRIHEDKDCMAILELNPLSKGHALIIPRIHGIEKVPEAITTATKTVSDNLKQKFSPKEIQIKANNLFGHNIIEIIPIFGDEKEKKKAKPEELEKLKKEILEMKKEEKKIETPKPIEAPKKIEEIIKLKPRIP